MRVRMLRAATREWVYTLYGSAVIDLTIGSIDVSRLDLETDTLLVVFIDLTTFK